MFDGRSRIRDSYTPSGAPASGSDETTYAYFTVEPNKGELRQVVRPGGNSTCTTDKTLCTSYTYDSNSRAVTVTDGNAQTTTTSYDPAPAIPRPGHA